MNEDDEIIIDTSEDIESEEATIENEEVLLETESDNEIIIINNTEFTCDAIIHLVRDDYNSLNLSKQKEIKKVIDNYVGGFINCIFKTFKTSSNVERLKIMLAEDEEIYSKINSYCSNSKIAFTKGVIDTVLKVYEILFEKQ